MYFPYICSCLLGIGLNWVIWQLYNVDFIVTYKWISYTIILTVIALMSAMSLFLS